MVVVASSSGDVLLPVARFVQHTSKNNEEGLPPNFSTSLQIKSHMAETWTIMLNTNQTGFGLMKQANIELLEWPFQSPDLLENMATTLKSHVWTWKSRDFWHWIEVVEGHLINYKGRYVQIFQKDFQPLNSHRPNRVKAVDGCLEVVNIYRCWK